MLEIFIIFITWIFFFFISVALNLLHSHLYRSKNIKKLLLNNRKIVDEAIFLGNYWMNRAVLVSRSL